MWNAPVLKSIVLVSLLTALSVPAHAQKSVPAVLRSVIKCDELSVWMNQRIETVKLIGLHSYEPVNNQAALQQSLGKQISIEVVLSRGRRALEFVRSMISKGDTLRVLPGRRKRDGSNRLLAYVYLPDGRMLNVQVLAAGYAEPSHEGKNNRFSARFREACNSARERKLGFWSGE